MMSLVLLLPLLQAISQQPDANTILTRSRDLSITGSMSATINLTIIEKNGSSRNRTISMTSMSNGDDVEKRLIRFIEPADVKGTSMLIVDNKALADEMWIYLPALKKTRRIVTSEKGKSFMSSEFSNYDMSSPPVSDFTSRHSATSGSDGQWIIESIPAGDEKADEYGFSKKLSYIDREDYQIRKMEFYNFENKLFKVIEILSTHPLSGGKYMVQHMTASNLLTGRKSEILFSRITEGIKVDDTFFTVQNLERQ